MPGDASDVEAGSLTASDVAEILGTHRGSVWRIPRDQLPYSTSAGGPERRGRRRYRRGDVERYRAGLPSVDPSIPDRVTELERWRAEHEQGHREGS